MSNITFYDCMPAVADVFSGTRPRPEPLPDTGILEHITGYIAADRIADLGEAPQVLAEKNQPPTWFADESESIREWNPGSPIVYAGGKLIGFNEDATSLTVLVLSSNSRERTEFIKHWARVIIDANNVPIDKPVKLLPLAKKLMDATGCGIDAAKRRIAQALRLKRGEYAKLTSSWGGNRPGAGRPKAE